MTTKDSRMVRLPADLVDAIDARRGGQSRPDFLRGLLAPPADPGTNSGRPVLPVTIQVSGPARVRSTEVTPRFKKPKK